MSQNKEALRKLQYERRKQVCEWLDRNPGWQNAPAIGRGIGVLNDSIRTYILWLERKDLLLVQMNEKPRRTVYYQLAKPINEVLDELTMELESEGDGKGNDLWLDPEHIEWMRTYRKKFVERRKMMNLGIPNFATEC